MVVATRGEVLEHVVGVHRRRAGPQPVRDHGEDGVLGVAVAHEEGEHAQPLHARERVAALVELHHRVGPVVHRQEGVHARRSLCEGALVDDGAIGSAH
eukprot:1085926-Prymnesium_polylepis.1